MTFIQARNYTPTNGRQIDLIVIHDMEAPEAQNTAENVASWFGGSNAPRASAHWCHDEDSSVQCVHDKDVAWAAPGANHNGLHHEQSGYAAQVRDEWLDRSSDATMRNMAAKVAEECVAYNIPVVFVDAAAIRRGERGITTHLEITRSGIGSGNHWDPGYEFPMDVFIGYVNDSLGGVNITPGPSVADDELLSEGDTGDRVSMWQTILIGAGLPVGSKDGGPDGNFGPTTTASTKAFQEMLGLTGRDVDGVVGPQTRDLTAKLLAWLAYLATQQNPPGPEPPPAPAPVAETNPSWYSRVLVWHSKKKDGQTMMSGGDVSRVQELVIQHGHGFATTVDGWYGEDTDYSVRSFQGERGLDVDGKVGPNTARALGE